MWVRFDSGFRLPNRTLRSPTLGDSPADRGIYRGSGGHWQAGKGRRGHEPWRRVYISCPERNQNFAGGVAITASSIAVPDPTPRSTPGTRTAGFFASPLFLPTGPSVGISRLVPGSPGYCIQRPRFGNAILLHWVFEPGCWPTPRPVARIPRYQPGNPHRGPGGQKKGERENPTRRNRTRRAGMGMGRR